jgi:hypothetical protein
LWTKATEFSLVLIIAKTAITNQVMKQKIIYYKTNLFCHGGGMGEK